MKTPITQTCSVTLHISLVLEDGTVVENTFDDEPLTFVMGSGTLDRGLELGLYGMSEGDKQRLMLDPGQAFGVRSPDNIHTMPLDSFATDMTIEPGVIIGFEMPDGEEVAGAVLELAGDTVTVDFNHPLAGRTIIYDVEILGVVSSETSG